MDSSFEISQLIVLTVGVGIGAQVLANYLKIPGIVCLLIFGIGLGRDGLDWLHPQLLGTGLDVIVSLSVALILFEGGLNLELRALNKVSGSLRNLVTLGTLIAFLGGGLAAHWLGEFPWAIAFLYSSLVVVTGPTVVGPLLKNVQVEKRVAALLEGEGVLIDPVGAILAVVVLDVVLNGGAEPLDVISGLAVRLGLGGLIGAIGFSEIAPSTLRRAAMVHPVAAVQSEYSLWTRLPELGMIQACAEVGAAFVPFSPVGRGVFSDHFPGREAFPDGDFRLPNPRFVDPNYEANLELIDGFKAWCASKGWPTAAVACAWCLAQGAHLVPIPGTRSAAHLAELALGASIELSSQELGEIERLLPVGFAHGARYSDAQQRGNELYC